MTPSAKARHSAFRALSRHAAPAFAALTLAIQLFLATGATLRALEGPAAAAAAASTAEGEWWGVVRLGGTPVGSVVERRRPIPGGGWETTSELALVLNRAGTRVEMTARSTAREDGAGGLRWARLESRLSSQVTTFEAEAVAGGLRLRSGSGGSAPPREVLLPHYGELLGPEGARRRTAAELRRPGDRLTYRQLVPELGGVLTIHRELVGITRAESGIETREIEERAEDAPGGRRIWLTADGEPLRQREPSPFGEMEVVRASRAEAEAARSGGSLPEEIYSRTLAPSNVRLPSPRDAERLRVRLTRLGVEPPGGIGSRPWPDLDGGTQRVLARGADAAGSGRSLELEVVRPAPPAGPVAPATLTAETTDFLAPNAWIESDDPEVVRLSRAIVGAEGDPYRQALLLTAWVHREMRFDLGIVMAPAAELARDRRGTCAGYATLLAALARAAGIPSRYVLGSVYVLGIWGGHAWVELSIGGRWLPFDAAVYSPGIADAARLAFARDSLRDGLGMAALSALALFGDLRVDTLEGVFAGAPRDFRAVRSPYALSGSRYENPGLGLTLAAPAGFTVSRAEAVWPDATLLELRGPSGVRAVLREGDRNGLGAREAAAVELAALGLPDGGTWRKLGGRPAFVRSAPGRSGAAWVTGTQLFTLLVEGANAGRVLDEVAAGMEWRGPAAQDSSAEGP